MGNRPATIVQADISRLIRAAKKAGAAEVEICLTNGNRGIIRMKSKDDTPLEEPSEIVL
jgi:hypothetical protein